MEFLPNENKNSKKEKKDNQANKSKSQKHAIAIENLVVTNFPPPSTSEIDKQNETGKIASEETNISGAKV